MTVLFLIHLVEAMVPLRGTRSCVRLATGLMLVLALLGPVLQVPVELTAPDWAGLPAVRISDIDRGSLERAQRTRTLALVEAAVKAEAERVAGAVVGVRKVVARPEVIDDPRDSAFGSLDRLRLEVDGTQEALGVVQEVLARHFQICPSKVEVSREGLDLGR